MDKISETERAAMSALGASLDQTDAVLAELAAMRSLVREMGSHIPLAISDRMDGWQAAKNSLAEILNRLEVKEIMKEV